MSIQSLFKNVIEDNQIKITKGIYVNIDVFDRIFKGAETYDDFIRIDNGEKGYKVFFDELKEKGILD